MDRMLIAGNWKMNKTAAEAKDFADEFLGYDFKHEDEISLIAPFTDLALLKDEFKDTKIKIGAQNCHYEDKGAFTGEISVDMLKEIGIDDCIVGHSERRQYFGETDKSCNLKLKKLIDAGIRPILCVGEDLDTREKGMAQAHVSSQLGDDLVGIKPADIPKIVIAYEPIWAIGTGKTATPDQAQDMCSFIRGFIGGLFGEAIGECMMILYGGSVKPKNAKDILSKEDINGALVGGASLSPKTFKELIDIADEMHK